MQNLFPIFKLILIIFLSVPVRSEGCNIGWFGPQCKYQCHCKNNMACDVSGECATGCDIGWFGTGCQYVDLATISDVIVTLTPVQPTTWLTDGNDSTCNESTNMTSLQISWKTSYPFTWLRIKVKNTSLKIINVNLTFTTSKNDTFNCINKQVSILDNTTVDYRCDMRETVSELLLTGPALKSLCSLYISGGRNVALHQTAEQTSTYSEYIFSYVATLAVDGTTKCNMNENSTSHTGPALNSSWSLKLDTPKVVNRFVIYNRADCCMNRLRNFILTAFDNSNRSLWTYNDTRTEAALIYTFTRIHDDPLSKITIIPTIKEYADILVVSLCEVFMYGECAPGSSSLGCNQSCPGECPTWCQQDTGACLSCLGHNDPPKCNTVCAPRTYGINCQQSCSNNCYNNTCDSVTGECDSGCNGYSNPPECTIECDRNHWGLNCQQSCSDNCYNKTCDKVSGRCDSGCVRGYSNPPDCSLVCAPGTYGINCQQNCSNNCYNNTCNSVIGECDSGCNGYSDPPECTIECDRNHWGLNCQQSCSDNCYNKTCDKVSGKCDSGCVRGYNNPPDCSLALPAHGSNTMSFETGIGIGVAIGTGIILLLDVVILLIYKARYSKSVLKESQGIDSKKETQLHEKNNKERQLQSLGTHSDQYDDFKHLNEYQHIYEKTHN